MKFIVERIVRSPGVVIFKGERYYFEALEKKVGRKVSIFQEDSEFYLVFDEEKIFLPEDPKLVYLHEINNLK